MKTKNDWRTWAHDGYVWSRRYSGPSYERLQFWPWACIGHIWDIQETDYIPHRDDVLVLGPRDGVNVDIIIQHGILLRDGEKILDSADVQHARDGEKGE